MYLGTLTSVWKKKKKKIPLRRRFTEGIQAVLGFPDLKILKPCNTSWLSHECCVKATCTEVPLLLQTLSQLYKSSGDAEPYVTYSLWLLLMVYQEVISYRKFPVPKLKLFMQKKIADFSKLPFMLKCTLDHLNPIRENDASRSTAAETATSYFEFGHGITIKVSRGPAV